MKRALKNFLNRYDLFAPFLLRREGGLYEEGWFRSYRQKAAVDRSGRPIPWLTYAAIHFLEERVNREMKVFEYGSGNSTLWWAERAGSVYACEHDRSWYEAMSGVVPANVTLRYLELNREGEYSREAARFSGAFDIVVVDGRERVNCIRQCGGALTPGGVVILDDSQDAEYAEGIRFLHDSGFRSITFEGLGPMTHLAKKTTIFYRPGNCLGI